MLTPAYLRRLFAYDRWANRRILESLTTLPDLHPSMDAARLFAHILVAQDIWLSRVHGRGTEHLTGWPQPSIASWPERMQKLYQAWTDLVTAPDTDFDRVVAYQNSKGIGYTTVLGDILLHVVIHGQHHRAQIALRLRENGQSSPPTDFIFFLRATEAS